MALEEGAELTGCSIKKKKILWQGMTTKGVKGAISTSPDLQQRGQQADSALAWRDQMKATYLQC